MSRFYISKTECALKFFDKNTIVATSECSNLAKYALDEIEQQSFFTCTILRCNHFKHLCAQKSPINASNRFVGYVHTLPSPCLWDCKQFMQLLWLDGMKKDVFDINFSFGNPLNNWMSWKIQTISSFYHRKHYLLFSVLLYINSMGKYIVFFSSKWLIHFLHPGIFVKIMDKQYE